VTLRMNRQSKNAQRIAEQLATHRRVERVRYPSLFNDREQIRIRDAQTDYPGSMMSLDIEGATSRGKVGGL
jgi:cystathionine beta-lyase/cystathionine gamma-synthase